jgi:hypothetical protein
MLAVGATELMETPLRDGMLITIAIPATADNPTTVGT